MVAGCYQGPEGAGSGWFSVDVPKMVKDAGTISGRIERRKSWLQPWYRQALYAVPDRYRELFIRGRSPMPVFGWGL